MTSVPSLNVTPATTLGNRFSPFSLRQVLAAAMTSLKTISRAVLGDKAPFVRTVRCRTVAKTDSMGFVTGMRIAGADVRLGPPRFRRMVRPSGTEAPGARSAGRPMCRMS